MADLIFEEPRLATIYDDVDSDRGDLSAYLALATEFRVRSVLDIGCGTGTFACQLAGRGVTLTALDPAVASLAVARRKPFAERVDWIAGDATALPSLQVDLATMTGNVAQVFLTDRDWNLVLGGARNALVPGGLLIFEVRDPAREGWLEWTRARTFRRLEIPAVGVVETWVDLIDVALPFVSFQMTFVFESDGAELISDSTLRFRSQAEIVDALRATGFEADEVRDAPDRPGREFVFIARRSA
jgi:SAM-dependent methyltransferase